MSRTRRPVALLLLLASSLHWIGSSLASNPLDLSSSASSRDEAPAVTSTDAAVLHELKRPVLQTKETAPPEGTHFLKSPDGQGCVRARLGVEYEVTLNKKKYYFNLNPSSVKVTGNCMSNKSTFSLDFYGGNLEFTFIKEGEFSYVTTVRGSLTPAPICKNCQIKAYHGIVDHEKLFKAKKGLSFNCKSEKILTMANDFKVKLVPLQIQAFDLASGEFGKEVECWEDYNKRMIPIILGAIGAGIVLIAILTCVLVREHRIRGYDHL